MKIAILFYTILVGGIGLSETKSIYDLKVKTLPGKDYELSALKNKTVLFVNTASQCGFTSQFKGLQALHKIYENKGLVVIGVPSNDFGAQEPGSNKEIAKFCKLNYGVDFLMLSKMNVKGSAKSDLYQVLVGPSGAELKWNFEKILVGKNGKVVGRFASKVKPMSKELTTAIEKAL